MLSKNIRPGTVVAQVRNPPALETYVADDYLEAAKRLDTALGEHSGMVFSVRKVVRCEAAACGYGVIFNECDSGIWPLECYRAVQLPLCLRETLLVAPRQLADA